VAAVDAATTTTVAVDAAVAVVLAEANTTLVLQARPR